METGPAGLSPSISSHCPLLGFCIELDQVPLLEPVELEPSIGVERGIGIFLSCQSGNLPPGGSPPEFSQQLENYSLARFDAPLRAIEDPIPS